jgi:hypothetical protein
VIARKARSDLQSRLSRSKLLEPQVAAPVVGKLLFVGRGDAHAGGGDGGVEEPELDDARVEVLRSEGFGASYGGRFRVMAEGMFEDGVQFKRLGFREGLV